MIKSQIQTGDTAHCTANRWISRIIQRVTKSKINHNAIFVWVNGGLYVFEAQAPGVYPLPFELWQERYGYSFELYRDTARVIDESEYIDTAFKYVGLKYGKLDLVRFWINLKLGVWLGIDKEHKKLVCSEYRMLVHEHFYDIEEDIARMTPKDVYRWEKEQGFTHILTYDGRDKSYKETR